LYFIESIIGINLNPTSLRKLTNTPEDKFQQTGHFISRVIKYQVNVINKNSILTIEVAPIKTGRKITHINFIISLPSIMCKLFLNNCTISDGVIFVLVFLLKRSTREKKKFYNIKKRHPSNRRNKSKTK
jgi:hypothetical protein